MAGKKIVLKVSIMCGKCKICIMTTVAKFDGVVSIAVDGEKSTVTIVGDVDAVEVVKALRKKRKPAKIVSVGEPEKEKEKEKEKKKSLPPCCNACSILPHAVWYEEPSACIIA